MVHKEPWFTACSATYEARQLTFEKEDVMILQQLSLHPAKNTNWAGFKASSSSSIHLQCPKAVSTHYCILLTPFSF